MIEELRALEQELMHEAELLPEDFREDRRGAGRLASRATLESDEDSDTEHVVEDDESSDSEDSQQG